MKSTQKSASQQPSTKHPISKKQGYLKRPRPILFCVAVTLFCTPWLLLLGIDTYLHQQKDQTDRQANAVFSQLPTRLSNPSAEAIDRLGAQLGLNPNATYTTPITINSSAAKDFSSIEPTLNAFLHSQYSKTAGPLSPLPLTLSRYLSTHKSTIDRLQHYLLSHKAPQWAIDSKLIADLDYPLPGFFNIRSIQKLLLLSTLQAQQQKNIDQVLNTLEASWRLNQTIAKRSDLSSQVLVAITSTQRASILRHLDHIPDTALAQWSARLQQQAKTQPIMEGMAFETWLRYRIKQNEWLPTAEAAPNATLIEKTQVLFANRFSAQSYFKLTTLNSTQASHRALQALSKLDICTTPQVVAERHLNKVKIARWNRGSRVPTEVFAKRWQTAGGRALSLELSHHVLQLKSHVQATGTWPIIREPIASSACPGEKWIYTTHSDGSISIALSKQLLSPSAIPLSYRTR